MQSCKALQSVVRCPTRGILTLEREQKWEVKGLVGQCTVVMSTPVSEDLQQANCPGRVTTYKRITHTRIRLYITHIFTHSIFLQPGSSTIKLFSGRLTTFLNLCWCLAHSVYSATCFRWIRASKLRSPVEPSAMGQLNMQGVYLWCIFTGAENTLVGPTLVQGCLSPRLMGGSCCPRLDQLTPSVPLQLFFARHAQMFCSSHPPPQIFAMGPAPTYKPPSPQKKLLLWLSFCLALIILKTFPVIVVLLPISTFGKYNWSLGAYIPLLANGSSRHLGPVLCNFSSEDD